MDKYERSLLLFLETCVVDQSGRVNTAHMNAEDMAIAKRWDEEGFVRFKRIHSSLLSSSGGAAYWAELSGDAWDAAAEERKARALRNRRNWTAELPLGAV